MNRFQRQHKALGSTAYITLVTKSSETKSNKIIEKIIEEIDYFENQFSRFKDDSLITKVNLSAGSQTKVNKEFLQIVKLSKELSLKTKNIFNPLILPNLQSAGYLGSWTKDVTKATNNTDFSEREIASTNEIELGDDWVMIPKNSALDFGGIGKGYLLDKLQLTLERQDLVGYWISLGGDIICSGYDLDNLDWSIDIQNAEDGQEPIGKIDNNNGRVLAIATSGITKRKGIHNNEEWHHIIDPRTGKPAHTDILTCTVSAHTGTSADVFAKCILIEGSHSASKYIKEGFVNNIYLQLSNGTNKNITN